MRRACSRERGGIGSRGAVSVVAVLLAMAVFGVLFAQTMTAPRTSAAGDPNAAITFIPSQGAVGTKVTVTINITSQADPAGWSYRLYATMIDPTTAVGDNDCDQYTDKTMQPIPGLGDVTPKPSVSTLTFEWPAALDHGPYWLCALPPGSGAGSVYYSSQPFTVIGAVPLPATTAGAVVTNIPASGIVAGNTFTISITNWHSPSGTPPQAVELSGVLPNSQTFYYQGPDSLSGVSAQFTTQAGPSAGNYTLTVSMPPLYPGTYWALVADQSGFVHSQEFTVLAAPTPTDVPPPPTANAAQTNHSDAPSLLVVGVLLAVAILMLASVLVRRRARLQRQRVR